MKTLNINEIAKHINLDNIDSNQDIVIIDVREPDEFSGQHITGAINIPLSGFNTADLSPFKNKTVIFHCRSGHRTSMNSAILESLDCIESFCIKGGIQEWISSKRPTNKQTNAPIDVMRQVQIIVSVMILAGLGLSFVSPYFLLLPAMAGIGLMIAGLTGFCGMANLLKFLPWNKIK